MAAKPGQIGQLVRTLGGRIRDALLDGRQLPPSLPEPGGTHRQEVVAKVSRNAVAELVNQARNHPQRGDFSSANPAYAALAELTEMTGKPGLALGLRNETGEISFLDLEMDPDEAEKLGGVHVERRLNRNLWRQLKHLAALKVDRNMLGPSRPIRSPEDPFLPDEGEDGEEQEIDGKVPGLPGEAPPEGAAGK
ncbi:MAG: hypothetical protein LBQ79_05840 [Deltaproteobacteria bacterium]|jgi:hypothetical protein|nr:hypothetical protein [Deltaproteobacteria bacterium]